MSLSVLCLPRLISIHVLREEDDNSWNLRFLHSCISIHVLREEDDGLFQQLVGVNRAFLSTSSARRTTSAVAGNHHVYQISIHVLREEDDEQNRQRFNDHHRISIHVLREEDDFAFTFEDDAGQDFYPRPPRGGRRSTGLVSSRSGNFYPRPPRGGRRRPTAYHNGARYFYPRPPRGGRRDLG